ncbi:PREDICTED: uncharacterized protein LOC105561915, partial [Vollenhovia emeryi]|uniref:uncharacterized protein LOC105561915 n=1 Tax=Vollenhovia emeryi TaxID=411798 RepID=UPI0005F50BF7
MISKEKDLLQIEDPNLWCPTGERVPVKCKVLVKVCLGQVSTIILMYVADIVDECLLGIDFLKETNFKDILETALGLNHFSGQNPISCSRVTSLSREAPLLLKELFESSSRELAQPQSEALVEFLTDFQDTFSGEIVAGSCDVVQHSIDVGDSLPIKQYPRRIPLHLREEVDGVIEEMRSHGVIEESHSPWVSPAVM